jgi:hypothetical protein
VRWISYLLALLGMTRLHQINSPAGLAAFGAFFVPEPLGSCLVLASAIWWLDSLERAQPVLGSLRFAAFWVLQKCFLIGRLSGRAAKLLTKDAYFADCERRFHAMVSAHFV